MNQYPFDLGHFAGPPDFRRGLGKKGFDSIPPRVALLSQPSRIEVVLDMQGGYGGAVYERLMDNGVTAYKFKGAEKAMGRTQSGSLKFVNKRSEAYWRVREALRKAHKTDAVVLSTDNPKTREKSVAERVVGRWLLFKPTYNRVLI